MFPPDQLVDETIKTAEKIAGYSKTIVAMCKECVNKGKKDHIWLNIANVFFTTASAILQNYCKLLSLMRNGLDMLN